MGTSQSKRDSKPGNPLIPPHADRDPQPDGGNPAAPPPQQPPQPQQPPATPQPAPTTPTVPLGRFRGFRTSLGRFASTGDHGQARSALGQWARSSGGSARVARAVRTGGALFGAISAAAAGVAATPDSAIDIRALQGTPIASAIDQIVDAFCPPGILDEELARIAIAQALDEALEGQVRFDVSAIDGNAVGIAVLAFVAEMVFVSVMGDAGRALANARSQVEAVAREADIRAITKNVTDFVGAPIVERLRAQGQITATAMSQLVAQLIDTVQAEMRTW